MITCALIVAAGSAKRFGGDVPKQYRELCGRPLLAWTIDRFERADSIDRIVLVVAEDYHPFVRERVLDPFDFGKVHAIVSGGATRQESVLNGLEALPAETGWVAIHDGARPLVQVSDIDSVVAAARTERAAMLAAPVTDTVKRVEQDYIIATLDRSRLFLAQTPQVFQYDLILAAHRESHHDLATDDASLVEARGFKVKVIPSTGVNIKVTTPDDLLIARALLEREQYD